MCGIAGVVGGGADVRRMTARLAHRGPDGEGFYEGTLGFRRLAIIDLATGAQPMKGCRDLWLVFNGEIYNYRELRSRLKHPFRTQSDSEVILHLFEEKGARCVEDLDGMFAFAIWDARNRTLFAARDRLGKKPLVYSHQGERFWFASELAALEGPRRLDRVALDHYLAFGYIPAPLTIFEGMRKLPPAHTLCFDGGQVRLARYWQPEARVVHESEDAYAERLVGALSRAVKKRLVADVPVGAFLSGGLDSSIVVGLMSQMQPTRTFSIGFREAPFNEAPYAKEAAAWFRTDHREFEVRPSALEVLPTLIERHGEPFGDASAIPTYILARESRPHVKVALSGDGGDELFAGYRRYRAIAGLARLKRWPAPLLKAGAFLLERLGSRDPARLGRLLGQSHLGVGELYSELMSIFPGTLRRELGSAGGAEGYLLGPFSAVAQDPAAAACLTDLVTYLPEDLLVKVDIATMAHGLEVRCPFLDREVVELALQIPSKLRLGKRVLRRAFRGLVPRRILDRRKMGFGVPLADWLRGELRGLLEDSVRSLSKRGIFDPAAVTRLANEHLLGAGDHWDRLWLLLVFELWHRRFLDAPAVH
jgi:asparagine synthase (glutamine-hydrolysing)